VSDRSTISVASLSYQVTRVFSLLLFSVILVSHIFAFDRSLNGAESQLKVCPTGCPYSSPQRAITAARAGDTVIFGTGEYQLNLTVEKSLELRTERGGEAVIQPERGGAALVIAPKGGEKITVSVIGLTFSVSRNLNVDEDRDETRAIYIQGRSDVQFEDVFLTGNFGCGLHLEGSGRADLFNSTISQNRKAICLEGGARLTVRESEISGNGIFLKGSAELEFENSTLSNHHRTSLRLEDSSRASITSTKISICETGVWASENSTLELRESKISHAGDGVLLRGRSQARIRDVHFSNCTSGLELREEARAFGEELEIVKNDHGVSLFDSAWLELRRSRLALNDLGLRAEIGPRGKVLGCSVRFFRNVEGDIEGLGKGEREKLRDRCK